MTILVKEYPFDIKFEGEQAVDCRAVDCRAVARDLLILFWEQVFPRVFDGCNLLIQRIYPGMQTKGLGLMYFVDYAH